MRENFSNFQFTWIRRAFRNSWQNLLRNKLLTIATILIIALMLFVFNLVLAMSYASDSVINNVGEKLDISVEILPEVENYTIQTFTETLRNNPNIKDVLFISKDEALGKFGSKYPNVITFLDYNNLSNPLPNIVRLTTNDIANNNTVISFLEKPQFSAIVNQEKLTRNIEQKERNEKILSISRTIKKISVWLIVVFALVGIMIIFNSININVHTHEKEIQIMKLVGAKYSFIRAGFILEGIAFAVIALIISLILSRVILAYLAGNLVSVISNEALMEGLNAILIHFEDNFWFTLGWQLLLTITAGLISSYMAIELYLRKKTSF